MAKKVGGVWCMCKHVSDLESAGTFTFKGKSGPVAETEGSHCTCYRFDSRVKKDKAFLKVGNIQLMKRR